MSAQAMQILGSALLHFLWQGVALAALLFLAVYLRGAFAVWFGGFCFSADGAVPARHDDNSAEAGDCDRRRSGKGDIFDGSDRSHRVPRYFRLAYVFRQRLVCRRFAV